MLVFFEDVSSQTLLVWHRRAVPSSIFNNVIIVECYIMKKERYNEGLTESEARRSI